MIASGVGTSMVLVTYRRASSCASLRFVCSSVARLNTSSSSSFAR